MYGVILPGHQFNKMVFPLMRAFHKEKNADCTIAVMEVPWEEASRFGIMTADAEGTITKFAEKPKEPESNLASMGIYIFTWEKLRKYLAEDEADKNSSNDFGKNIIPNMLGAGEKMVAYPFEGYWKDVGTIDSLWEANMDLLQSPPAFNLYDSAWRIYARNPIMPPHYVGQEAYIADSMVTEGCEVYGSVEHSVLFAGVVVEKGATVKDSVILDGVRICEGAQVRYSILDAGTTVGRGACVGCERKNASGITLVGGGLTLPENAVIPDGGRADAAYVAALEQAREAV